MSRVCEHICVHSVQYEIAWVGILMATLREREREREREERELAAVEIAGRYLDQLNPAAR